MWEAGCADPSSPSAPEQEEGVPGVTVCVQDMQEAEGLDLHLGSMIH